MAAKLSSSNRHPSAGRKAATPPSITSPRIRSRTARTLSSATPKPARISPTSRAARSNAPKTTSTGVFHFHPSTARLRLRTSIDYACYPRIDDAEPRKFYFERRATPTTPCPCRFASKRRKNPSWRALRRVHYSRSSASRIRRRTAWRSVAVRSAWSSSFLRRVDGARMMTIRATTPNGVKRVRQRTLTRVTANHHHLELAVLQQTRSRRLRRH
mmetsp:Transcript_8016/g.29673  ORF Transcript_8016/g.29673 Transcript_8016/m.29673 type:complete len:214 (+) Transcript_8016:1142-1783(+)